MVYAAFQDLDLRRIGEDEIKARLAVRGIVCHRSADVFFPGGTHDTLEARSGLGALGIKSSFCEAAAQVKYFLR